jgi:hypothetical protein
MKCKDCNTEHPSDEIANPHYCIARMEERIDKLTEALGITAAIKNTDDLSGIYRAVMAAKAALEVKG